MRRLSAARIRSVRARARLRVTPRVSPPLTTDLAAWCAGRGIEVAILSPSQRIERRLPTALEGPPHPSYERRLLRTVSPRILVCLDDVRLWGRNGHVVLPDGSFVVEAVYGRHHVETDPAYFTAMPRRAVAKAGDYFSLIGEFSNNGNYYHWVHDGLLRLHGVDDLLPPDVRYLVPPNLYPYQRDSLRALGLADDQLVPYDGREAWRLERLWFASLPPSGAEVSTALNWFRDRIQQATSAVTTPTRRLYISRRSAAHARLLDEAELAPILEKYGFEIVQTEQLSFVEQVRTFAQAECIVAPHGAGQTNMIFASRRTKNLEIVEPGRPPDGHPYLFWILAESLGQPFFYVSGDSVPSPQNFRDDVRIEPAVFERALAHVVAG